MGEFFSALTPQQVLRAVEAGGFAPTGHVSALTCLENRVYDLRLESGAHVVAKFYRPGRWSRAAILEEHAFLAELREAEIPVCAPLAFGDGLLCLTGSVTRLFARPTSNGTVAHALTHGSGPGTFGYQLWFRNLPASYCDPLAGFNTSNACTLTWE